MDSDRPIGIERYKVPASGGKIQSVQEDMASRRIVEQARTLQNHTIQYVTAISGGLGGGERSLLSDDDVVVE